MKVRATLRLAFLLSLLVHSIAPVLSQQGCDILPSRNKGQASKTVIVPNGECDLGATVIEAKSGSSETVTESPKSSGSRITLEVVSVESYNYGLEQWFAFKTKALSSAELGDGMSIPAGTSLFGRYSVAAYESRFVFQGIRFADGSTDSRVVVPARFEEKGNVLFVNRGKNSTIKAKICDARTVKNLQLQQGDVFTIRIDGFFSIRFDEQYRQYGKPLLVP